MLLDVSVEYKTGVGEFDISYMELDESWITVSGQEGSNDFYVSDVSILVADGYVLVTDQEESQITLTEDGEHNVSFRIRRISDGAMTDLVTRTVSIDKTAPTGTITLDETGWSKFLQFISFGMYKVNSLKAEISAQDNTDVDSIEYVITDTAYASVTELEEASLTWKNYSEANKPTIKENENQIIYVRITDMAGNVSYICSDGIHVDTLAPEVSIAITGTTSSSVSFTITSSEAGTYYYTVLKATDEVPTAEQIKQGGTGVILAENVGQGVALTAGGLEQNVVYVIYAVAEDEVFQLSTGAAAPNTSAVAVSNPVTTDRVNLNDGTVQVEVQVSDALYTGAEVEPAVKVLLDGKELVEGVDYEVAYFENVEVSSDKPYVRVTGINDYAGILTANFAIDYLPLDESLISISGVEGEDGYYVSDAAVVAAEGYELVVDDETADITFTTDGEHSVTFRIRRVSDGAMTDLVTRTVSVDKTAPTGSVEVGTNVWKELLHIITFGLFFNETQEAKITADDAFSGVASIGYVVSDRALNRDELDAQTWTGYTKAVAMDKDGNYVVYAKLTDKAGNAAYISSDGLVIDTTAPVIADLEDGGVYYGDTTFQANDANMDHVTVDGQVVELTDGAYTVAADNAQHTIVVTDKAGNSTEYKITVYKVYTVTYIADGEVVSTQTVKHGEDAEEPAIPEKSGYTAQWSHDGKNITADMVITAVYTEIPATEPPATEPPATEPPATESPTTEPPATEPPETQAPESDVPKTGDESRIVLWSILALVSLCVIIVLVANRRSFFYKGKYS